MKILGAWSGHDCSYSILEDGKPIIHDEYERFIREKEPAGDSLEFFTRENKCLYDDIDHIATCVPVSKLKNYEESFRIASEALNKKGGKIFTVGHHQAHAANAFFSSNFESATIITIDGGGVEIDNTVTACTVSTGFGNNIGTPKALPISQFNIGGLWTRATRYIFKLQSGWPRGHQAGTVMAMAALGDASRFYDDFHKMLTSDLQMASHKPSTQPRGALVPGNDPVHPYLNRWVVIADQSDQDKYDLAAGLQAASENVFKALLSLIFSQIKTKNLCLSGGVSLNSVMIGKIKEWFPHIENVFVTPIPHDGGLAIGASQYVWHHVMGNPRIIWKDNFTPYLGKTYSREEVTNELKNHDNIDLTEAVDTDVLNLLNDQKLVSVFGGGSESGRRALGNRSILADPRSSSMKDIINEKVKHRQSFRPFAPSILREEVSNWFTTDQSSPYMSFVLTFKDDKKELVPAVNHINNTARLQSVTENDNKWYYGFLSEWNNLTGVPILLNTSFNDREPICETPAHALACFLRTNIDYLYFYDYGILVSKK